MDEEQVKKVYGSVCRFLPPSFDRENVALEILMSSFEKTNKPPSWGFIRNKCIDVMRRGKRELKANEAYLRQKQTPEESLEGVDELVEELIKVLTLDEKKAIFHMFYQGLSITKTSKKLHCTKAHVKELLSTAIFKMRQEVIDE